ncbi:Autotransporter-associated beta strand repeat protein [Botrimarina colliarenosi]|uniref:Autotransporter-associated beta strand repeat protein n=1 Tax=Botrimarina colliarenosi TaxID=2528001 RepID=A0A5C5ZVW4_9BACT|nr:autotransporter-associated beta strand repeat-containing protein [Botrimarina colliarenosi]TWT91722.1 Autotransporter-associated beta strand repeat protein [Botrimarina colliarenosi]
MTFYITHDLLRRTALFAAVLLASTAHAVIIGFEAEDGSSTTTSVTPTLGTDFTPAESDLSALGGAYLTRTGNASLTSPGSLTNVLSYDVDFAEAGEYDLYARLLVEVGVADDSFYYGNGFGAKDVATSSDWVRPNGLPDQGFPAATYFWINLSENIGAFPSGTPTTFTVDTPGIETIQFGGREDGLYFDAFAFGTSTDIFTDQQLNEAVTDTFNPPNEWGLAGGGDFNTAVNWTDGVVPTFDALFGTSITQNAEITLDNPGASLNSVTINNTSNQYTLAGPNALTLVASAQVSTSGTHVIAADVAGSVGLTKLGNGTLLLEGAKSYTGTTDVQVGTLRVSDLDAIDNQSSSALNIEAGATVVLDPGTTGTLAAQLTGASTIDSDATLRVNDAVSINRSNAGFGGVVRVDGGTLSVSNSNALGDGGQLNDRTVVQAGTDSKVALSGNVAITSEVLDFEGRSTDAPGLTSSGTNSWNGVIRGEGTSVDSQLNIESTSGTLTLNRLYAEDSNEQFSYVFSGAGNTTITGRISDADIDIDADIVTVKANDNVGVVKRGSGTLTIGYASAEENDYWFGPTVIEEGTLSVNASGGTVGELRSSSITVQSGGTLDVSAYTEYTQQIGQAITGSGSINAGSGNLRLIDVSNVAPGDAPGAVGELTVTSGTVTLPDLGLGGGGAWSFDVGNDSDASGDLLNVQNGSFTASTTGITFNVTPAHGHLDAGSRTIISHTGGANSGLNSATAQITDSNGNVLNTRQTVAVNGSTAGQVNVVVTGEEASRTWSGGVSGAWDTATSNWQGGDQQFRDLDHVTFNDSASTTNVNLAANRAPGSMTFANSAPYTFSGTGGIVGSGDINVTGTGEVTLGNSGNSFTGTTTIDAGSSLRMTTASTGSITNSGTLSLGTPQTINVMVQNGTESVGTGGYKVFAFEAEEFQSLTENAPGDTTWIVRNDIAGSSGAGADGEALYATETTTNTNTSTTNKNFVTYNMKFTEPGSYMWFFHGVSTDGGNAAPGADGDAGNDDSFYTVTGDMDSGNTDPAGLGSRVDNFGSARIAAEGVIPNSDGSLTYDWYRNGDSESNAGEFHRINVTQSDVDAGTIFNFKIGTREGGMTLDKFAFVADADFSTDPNFGTLTDADLAAASSVSTIQDTFTGAGSILDVNGDFTMTDGATLNMLLSSPNVHDQLNVSGLLSADGVLALDAAGNGFAAEAGDVFDIFAFDSVSGAFDDIQLPALALGLEWDTSNLLVTGELAVSALVLPGDYNADGFVNAADYTVWRDNVGTDIALANDLIGGTIGSAQYDQWSNNYGSSYESLAAASQAIPEPSSALLLSLIVAAVSSGFARRVGAQ